ncbi:universal stress protein [Paenibacillus apiarius]|uniref:Universal stress protein n=1 Tax=Paenibacillus apiarius TaxID=46240 RepID=A0ABT4E4G3_9BACL|nr:universal stress protein [Paenibacillus apiarius]MBN3525019.1 universal stress protein [Paenibacillus apiarius]MCY9515144.1 universal stress protein [Paenibacillus apiarius]MCY9523398.1 universal stress protein [Paenibacillus apiarius]MCY9550350.1 universal stress protein [Paenibacillus apiarius]MCY9560748.1 universal stress protein [Paenibacillus apiarius]
MVFQRILVAYDSSEPSRKALEHAISIAENNAATHLRVVHVFQFPQYFVGTAYATASAETNEELYEYAERIQQEAEQKTALLGERAEVALLQGPPGQSIVAEAEDHKCDLIIIGSRGLSGLKEFVLGSVSHHVVQHAKVPVLVMK